MSTRVLSTSRKRTTGALKKIFGEYCVDGHLLLAVKYFCSDVCVRVGGVKSQPFTVVLYSDKDGCCHHSS